MSNDDGFRDFQQRISRGRLLTAVEERELARRVQLGDEDARRTFVEANLRLVVHFARRVHHPDSRLSLMDLVQEGSLGLVRAVEHFDHKRGVRFGTYARYWINDALYKALDENARIVRLPADVRQDVKRLREAERSLQAQHHRTPTTAQLADELGIDTGEVARLRAAVLTPTSLDAAIGHDGEDTLGDLLPDERPEDVSASVVRAEREGRLGELLEHLPPIERQIIERRYGVAGGDMASLRDIAKALGTSQAKLRAQHDVALRRLRAMPEVELLHEAA